MASQQRQLTLLTGSIVFLGIDLGTSGVKAVLVGTHRTDEVTKDQVLGMIILGKLPEEKTSEEVPKFY